MTTPLSRAPMLRTPLFLLALLCAVPASGQARAAHLTATATVVAPLETRPAEPLRVHERGEGTVELVPSPRLPGRRGAPRITVTLPDGAVCSGASASGPLWLPCGAAQPARLRAVVIAAG